MKLFAENINLSLRVSQNVFTILGAWAPTDLKGVKKIIFNFYTVFSFFFFIGSYIIIQMGDLCQVWGDVPLMTNTMFLLLTNLVLSTKVANAYWREITIRDVVDEANQELSAERRPEGRKIVDRCNRETKIQLYTYLILTYFTIGSWTVGAEKNELPLRAWYPYDTSKTPAYQLTYAHQCFALFVAASFNICLDTLVTTLISQCCCRLRLLSLSLQTLCDDLIVTEQGLLTGDAETVITQRIGLCVRQHQAILHQADQLQKLFSIPVLAQFSVSMGIICVTAYQMAIVGFRSLVWFIAMFVYMTVMLMQVFIYCYHGNQLVIESGKIAGAVYCCPWYLCRPGLRRCLLLVILRAQCEVKLKAGGLTELSLATFMAILKASYSFFTVLQQVEDSPNE